MTSPLLFLLLTAGAGAAQDPQEPVPVFKTGTTLVRVDAVVTDKKGAQVRDLTAEDFEIEADGTNVPVRVASFIPVFSRSPASTDPAEAARAVRRIVAFYVSIPVVGIETPMSSRTTTIQAGDKSRRVARMLDVFFKTQMSPTDLVAIARADSTSMEMLGNFGDDRAALELAGAQVGKVSVDSASAPLRVHVIPPDGASSRGYIDSSALVDHSARVLASLEGLISAMERLPGRRLLFFVGNLRLTDRPGGGRVPELNVPVKTVIDHANRAGVTLFGIEPSGLESGSTHNLEILAKGTGGSVIGMMETLGPSLGKILDRHLGYYSLGYEPAGHEKRPVQRVRVRVKRKGVQVTSRPVAFVDDGDASRP